MPVFRADSHSHTTFSVDGRSTMDEQCRAAIARGLNTVTFTEHLDFQYPDNSVGFFRPLDYLAEIERCRERYLGQLEIMAGVEMGEPHRFPTEHAATLDELGLDFRLGSLHWIDGLYTGGPEYFAAHEYDEAYRLYFDDLLNLAQNGDYDCMSHFDLPKRYAGPFDPEPFRDQIIPILETLVERGKGIEINMKKYASGVEPQPGLTILRWYREAGGEILTIGTDGHHQSDLGANVEIGHELARSAGFQAYTTFVCRKPRWHDLAE